MARTLNQVRQMIAVAMGEPLSTTEVDAAINEAIGALRGSLFVVQATAQVDTLVSGTYEYSLDGGALNLGVIMGVDIEDESIPAYGWDLIEGATSKIRLNKLLYPSLAGDLRVHGFDFQAFVTTGSDEINIDADCVVTQACSVLHASRLRQVREMPESDSLINLHEQEQAKFSALAQIALERAIRAQALPSTARKVRSNIAT